MPLYGIYELTKKSYRMRQDDAARRISCLKTAPNWLNHIPHFSIYQSNAFNVKSTLLIFFLMFKINFQSQTNFYFKTLEYLMINLFFFLILQKMACTKIVTIN